MLLRPYQKRLVDRAVKALADHGNTLAVAATGAGKTICLSAIGKAIDGKTLVLQHRHELVQQNCAKYRAVNPKTSIGLWTASRPHRPGLTAKAFAGSSTTSVTISRYASL